MALHQTIYSKFIRNTHVRELVHAGIASLGPNGGAFTLPGYPTVNVVTDFALTELQMALMVHSWAVQLLQAWFSVKVQQWRRSTETKRKALMATLFVSGKSPKSSSKTLSQKSAPKFFPFWFIQLRP
jgi:hypothetical protein